MSSINNKGYLRKLLKSPSSNFWVQLFRYGVSGGFAFICDSSTLIFFTEVLHFDPVIASMFGFSVGLIVTYILSIFWIFDQRRVSNHVMEFIFFVIIGVIGFGLNTLFMWIFVKKYFINYIISKVFTTIVVTLWNFIAKKYLLFVKD